MNGKLYGGWLGAEATVDSLRFPLLVIDREHKTHEQIMARFAVYDVLTKIAEDCNRRWWKMINSKKQEK